MLHSAPFSIYNDQENDELQQFEKIGGALERTVTIGEAIDGTHGAYDFSFTNKPINIMGTSIQEEEDGEEEERPGYLNSINDHILVVEPSSPPKHLATGLGLDRAPRFADGSNNGVNILSPRKFCDINDAEEYHKKMVNEYPFHPLFLSTYAQLLQAKGNFDEAEKYYLKATEADPENGEILMKYAKLVWELRGDKAEVLSYLKRAAQVSTHDSHVIAAYASFLWELEDDGPDDQDEMKEEEHSSRTMAALAETGRSENIEDDYEKMLEENPINPLFLRNYAQFLYQCKGDLPGAEEYYSCAILANPKDGEIFSEYAKLVWELHRDREKALCYFERAVEASRGDSHVLAAYASFLWNVEEDEEEDDCARKNSFEAHFLEEGISCAART